MSKLITKNIELPDGFVEVSLNREDPGPFYYLYTHAEIIRGENWMSQGTGNYLELTYDEGKHGEVVRESVSAGTIFYYLGSKLRDVDAFMQFVDKSKLVEKHVEKVRAQVMERSKEPSKWSKTDKVLETVFGPGRFWEVEGSDQSNPRHQLRNAIRRLVYRLRASRGSVEKLLELHEEYKSEKLGSSSQL